MGYTYVISDIHGCYDSYIKALELIEFSDEDILYILGDIVDRGDEPIKVLKDMMKRPNIIPILGNHDFMAWEILDVLKNNPKNVENQEEAEFVSKVSDWVSEGGKSTYEQFMSLCTDEQIEILDYIEDFEVYEEVSCGSIDYILVHGGLGDFKKDKNLDEYSLDDFIDTRVDYDKIYFHDKILVTGHTPTRVMCNEDKIYKKNNHIAIDCACVFGGKLGIIRLDDQKEFYV